MQLWQSEGLSEDWMKPRPVFQGCVWELAGIMWVKGLRGSSYQNGVERINLGV